MSEFNCLQPPLEPAERAIIKGYSGWGNFMLSYGLKPWENDDAEEGLAILKGLAKCNEEDAKQVKEEAAKKKK